MPPSSVLARIFRLKPAPTLADPQSTTPQQPQETLPTTGNPSFGPSHRIRLVSIQLDPIPSHNFGPITRDVEEGDAPFRIGRIGTPSPKEISFEFGVISRAHAEIWAESGGKFFIRDTKSSSGTFINFSRLSPPNVESQPFQLGDGDVLQFGVPYRGGFEDVNKCVMVRVEINKEPQAAPNVSESVPLSQLCCPCVDTPSDRREVFYDTRRYPSSQRYFPNQWHSPNPLTYPPSRSTLTYRSRSSSPIRRRSRQRSYTPTRRRRSYTPSRTSRSRPHTPSRHSRSITPSRRSRSRPRRPGSRSYSPARRPGSRYYSPARRSRSRSYSPSRRYGQRYYSSPRRSSPSIRLGSRSPDLRSSPYDPRTNRSSGSPQPPRALSRGRPPGEARSSGDDASQDSDSHEVEHESSLAPPWQGLAKPQAQPDGLVESSSLEPVDTAMASVSETGMHLAPPPSPCVEH